MSDYIQHHGILGMKWGVRRTREELSKMSDDEIRDKIARMELEERYISTLESSHSKHGKKAFDKAISALGNVATVSNSVTTIGRNIQTMSGWYTDYRKKSDNSVPQGNKPNVLRRIASDAPRTAMNLSRKAQEAYSRHKYNPWKHK